jgi:hypothetical protein
MERNQSCDQCMIDRQSYDFGPLGVLMNGQAKGGLNRML